MNDKKGLFSKQITLLKRNEIIRNCFSIKRSGLNIIIKDRKREYLGCSFTLFL